MSVAKIRYAGCKIALAKSHMGVVNPRSVGDLTNGSPDVIIYKSLVCKIIRVLYTHENILRKFGIFRSF